MFQVYHTRDNQFGMVFEGDRFQDVDGRGNPRLYVRWSCGYVERYREGGFVRAVGAGAGSARKAA